MGKLYNNPFNIEAGAGWAGRQGTYANHRKRRALTYTLNGKVVELDWEKYEEQVVDKYPLEEGLENHDEAQTAIRELVKNEFGHNIKINFAKPFVHFDSKEAGLRAGFRLLQGDRYIGGGMKSLDAIINKFAPKSENSPGDYAKHVNQAILKINPSFNQHKVTITDVENILRGIAGYENLGTFTNEAGKNISYDDYYLKDDKAWEIAKYAATKSFNADEGKEVMIEYYNNREGTQSAIQHDAETLVATNEQGEALDLYSGLKLAFAETATEEVKPITKEQIETSSVDASGKTILPDFGDAPVEKDYEVGASLTQIGDEDYAADVDALFKAEDFEVGGQADVEFSTNISQADPNYRFHIRKGGQKIYIGELFGEDVLGYTGTSKIGKHTVTYGAERVGEGSTQFIEGSGQHGKTNISYGLEKDDDTTKGFVRLKGKL